MNDILFEDKIADNRHNNRSEENKVETEDEDGYFATYSHYSIHEEMLKVHVCIIP